MIVVAEPAAIVTVEPSKNGVPDVVNSEAVVAAIKVSLDVPIIPYP